MRTHPLSILVACESSGIVREAFAVRGHNAWSCDLKPTEQPGQHYQGNILEILHGPWDLLIAHPPCTHLAVSGARWFKHKHREQAEALAFCAKLLEAPVKHIALENPVSILASYLRRPDQIVQPWWFGHRESKKTCLWLKNLPRLFPTQLLQPEWFRCVACKTTFASSYGLYDCACFSGYSVQPVWDNQTPTGQNKLGQSDLRSENRSRTYQGIAEAMAAQWGDGLLRKA